MENLIQHIFIYKITNLINNKIYIGQSFNPIDRWQAHKREAKKAEPIMVISKAIKKHGAVNFTFEIIACCIGIDNANFLETYLVSQYESHISTGKGYNVSLGGSNAPKTEEWKNSMSAIKGGWIDRKHTEDSLNKNIEAHTGIKQSEETILKRSESMKKKCAEGWMPKTIFTSGSDAAKYWLGKESPQKGKKASKEAQANCIKAGLLRRGRPTPNRIVIADDIVKQILELNLQGNGSRQISSLVGLARHLIIRVLKEHNRSSQISSSKVTK